MAAPLAVTRFLATPSVPHARPSHTIAARTRSVPHLPLFLQAFAARCGAPPVSDLPVAVLGLLFKDAIETILRNLYLTATMLIVFAVFLALADRLGHKLRTLDTLGWGHGLLFGLAQALALIPGVSRSGGTITAGLLMGYTREAAARYSFLLAIPAVMASGFYQFAKTWGQGVGPLGAGPRRWRL